MKTFKITNPTEDYSPSYFICTYEGEIYADNEEIGFFKHPKITDEEKLFEHLKKLEKEGYIIEIFYQEDKMKKTTLNPFKIVRFYYTSFWLDICGQVPTLKDFFIGFCVAFTICFFTLIYLFCFY